MRHTLLAAAAVSACAAFVPATDSSIWYAGRNRVDSDGSREFDWEGSQVYINVQNAASVVAQISSDAGATRLIVAVSPLGSFNWTEYGAVWVAPGTPSNVTVAAGLPAGSWTIRLFNDIEPSAEGSYGNMGIRFQGFFVAGTVLPAGPFSSRKIEWVGDSITVGYGSIGVGPCQASDLTSSNWNAYDRMICDHFAANCTVVAWSGKGMYENCCDSGETMPSYYLDTLGSGAYAGDWDFARFTPDAVIINLGTNDMGHYNGPAWGWVCETAWMLGTRPAVRVRLMRSQPRVSIRRERRFTVCMTIPTTTSVPFISMCRAAFTSTYVQFMVNASRVHYNNPSLPFFVAQGPMNDSETLFQLLQWVIGNYTAQGGKATFLDMRGQPTDGCGGHPGRQGHAGMAAAAIPQIASAMGW